MLYQNIDNIIKIDCKQLELEITILVWTSSPTLYSDDYIKAVYETFSVILYTLLENCWSLIERVAKKTGFIFETNKLKL